MSELPPSQQRDDAEEVRGVLKASGAFDRTARIYALVNCLESRGLSAETEARDLRAEVERLREALEAVNAVRVKDIYSGLAAVEQMRDIATNALQQNQKPEEG